ncbi:hypothetical protein TNCV_4731671 [Trichonephila clavipes]|nr:hypothetical protein TNCV_4731671 [Trichonephila clavipes]
MTEFIDLYEVWFLPESVARVIAFVGDHAATRLGIDSKRLWSCSWDSMCCAMVRDVTEQSVTVIRTICLSLREEVHVIDHVGPSYPPATNGHISALQLFRFV